MHKVSTFACLAILALALRPVGAPGAPADDRLILTPADRDVIFEIEGVPPRQGDVCQAKRRGSLFAKYRGTLEIVPQAGGQLRIINELSFSEYLAGLAEVPLSWPTAALRAQVIAARSYAMDAYRRGRSDAAARGYDICSTDQCQVYRGAAVELGAFGERWVEAIRRTHGKVLRYGGRVIQAFYFSTSDGSTRRSFPGGTPQPWLPAVDGNDARAPLGRWTAPFRLTHLAEILRIAGSWSGAEIRSVRDLGDDVRISSGVGSAVLSKRDLRIDVNNEASCRFPNLYPNPTGSQSRTRLPQAIPSSSYDVRQTGGRVVFRGRGWGHFVGMSQWGAYYMAGAGRSASQILDHFYGAAWIGQVQEPASIRVLAAEDLRQVRIRVRGDVRVTTGTGSVLAPGRRFTVTRGLPPEILRGKGPRQRGVLEVRATARALISDGLGPVKLPFEASRPVRVTLHVLDEEGTELLVTPERSFEAGTRTGSIAGTYVAAFAAGRYAVVIEAYDGIDRVRTVPIPLTIAPSNPELTPSQTPTPVGPNRTVPITIGLGVVLLTLGAIAARLIRR